MKRVIKKVKMRHVREIVVYGIVGSSALLLQTIMYVFLIHVHVFPSIAMMVGTFSGMILSYFGHVKFTFKKNKFSHREFVKFAITSCIGLVLNVASVRIITKVLLLNPHYAIIPTLFTPLVTFLISKFWAFR